MTFLSFCQFFDIGYRLLENKKYYATSALANFSNKVTIGMQVIINHEVRYSDKAFRNWLTFKYSFIFSMHYNTAIYLKTIYWYTHYDLRIYTNIKVGPTQEYSHIMFRQRGDYANE